MTAKGSLAFLLPVLMARFACVISPSGSVVLVSFQSSAYVVGQPVAPPHVTVTHGRVEVRGIAATPTPCYALAGDLAANGLQIVVRVVARPQANVVCVQATSHFAYSAVMTLPPGTYALSVQHVYPDTAWTTVEALTDTVKID
jgi:hypothetical protein